MASEVLWLGEAACGETLRAGGKAASLSRLARAYAVPEGFCIPTGICARWPIDGSRRDGSAAELLETVIQAYEELSRRCGSGALPVAVRSSAVDEDGAAASFSGQYETLLNVCGSEAVVAAVSRCIASANSERVIAYRAKRGLRGSDVPLAVLVQQLIAADVTAVVFSVNPVTGDRGEIVINANWGLGESLVEGSVTPDMYVVRRTDLAILSRSIARKRRMTTVMSAGTREVDVPGPAQCAPTLDDGQVVAVASLAIALESVTGSPVDVECAYREKTLFLLQCRPVTTVR